MLENKKQTEINRGINQLTSPVPGKWNAKKSKSTGNDSKEEKIIQVYKKIREEEPENRAYSI